MWKKKWMIFQRLKFNNSSMLNQKFLKNEGELIIVIKVSYLTLWNARNPWQTRQSKSESSFSLKHKVITYQYTGCSELIYVYDDVLVGGSVVLYKLDEAESESSSSLVNDDGISVHWLKSNDLCTCRCLWWSSSSSPSAM